VKRWANAQGVKAVDTWLGISVDEMERVQRGGGKKWRERYVLIEQRMNRGDCIALVQRMGWPPAPRSSCYICPNHLQNEWVDMRENKPADWRKAVAFDKFIRIRDANAFLHSDCVPLDQADLSEANGVLFKHCDSGMCFV
jgi:hypothetical protein